MTAARLAGLGAHRPATRVSSADVAGAMDSSEQWIVERSGIATRGRAGEGESVVDMAVDAAGKALADAGVDAGDVDMVLLATCSLTQPLPAAAPRVAARLGATSAGAVDLNAACAGFCYGLGLAADSVRAGSSRHVLVIGSERMLDIIDPADRGTAFLFGDGAGAALVSATDGPAGIHPTVYRHDGAMADLLVTHGSPPVMTMEGRAIYRWAATSLPGLAREACERAGIAVEDLAAFVPHQANLRITEAVVSRLKLPDTVAVATDVVESGNTSAASVPLALSRLREQGRVRPGDPVLLAGFGAGLAAAAQVVVCP